MAKTNPYAAPATVVKGDPLNY